MPGRNLPRDADGDGLIYEGTPRERPAPLRRVRARSGPRAKPWRNTPTGKRAIEVPRRTLARFTDDWTDRNWQAPPEERQDVDDFLTELGNPDLTDDGFPVPLHLVVDLHGRARLDDASIGLDFQAALEKIDTVPLAITQLDHDAFPPGTPLLYEDLNPDEWAEEVQWNLRDEGPGSLTAATPDWFPPWNEPEPTEFKPLGEAYNGATYHQDRLPQGVEATVTLLKGTDGSLLVEKRWKVRGGGNAYAKSQADKEEAASLISAAVGALTPEVYRPDPNAIVMPYVDGVEARPWMPGALDGGFTEAGGDTPMDSDSGRLLALFDYLTFNSDRHGGNMIVTPDYELVGLDHGFMFDTNVAAFEETGSLPPSRGWVPLIEHWIPGSTQWGPNPNGGVHPDMAPLEPNDNYSSDELAAIRANLIALKPELARLGYDRYLPMMLARLDRLAAVVPQLKKLPRDGDGDGFIWDGTPRETLRAPLAAIYEAADDYRKLPQGMTSDIWVRTGPLGDVVVKVFKPNPVTKNPKVDCDREWLAYQVAEALEAPVPRMERRNDTTILMDFVETGPNRMSMNEVVKNPEGRKIGVLDFVTANPDRHPGNILFDVDGDPVAVDQGLAFQNKWRPQYGPAAAMFPQTNRAWQNPNRQHALKPHDLSAEEVADIRRRLEPLEPRFAEHPDWYAGMMKRVDMLEAATTKALPRDGDGDGLIYEGTPQERPAAVRGYRPAPVSMGSLFYDPIDPDEDPNLVARITDTLAPMSRPGDTFALPDVGSLDMVDWAFQFGDERDVEGLKVAGGMDGYCFDVAGGLTIQDPERLSMFVGWARSPDGLWVQHGWVEEEETATIIEPTSIPRTAYFGAMLPLDYDDIPANMRSWSVLSVRGLLDELGTLSSMDEPDEWDYANFPLPDISALRESKALPRDGDGDGWIDEGKPTERPAPLRSPVRANLTTVFTEQGTYGNRTHITMEERGTIPTAAIANLPGKSGEIPGEHRNRKGEAWDAFLADIAANGIDNGIFIVVEPDGVSIYEGNHRRDAAVELGLPEVPVQIRYFGKMEDDGTFMERYERGELTDKPEPADGLPPVPPGMVRGWHYSPQENRASILANGLRDRDVYGDSLAESNDEEPGIYLFLDRDEAEMLTDAGGDVYAVDYDPALAVPDPYHESENYENRAIFLPVGSVAPENVHLAVEDPEPLPLRRRAQVLKASGTEVYLSPGIEADVKAYIGPDGEGVLVKDFKSPYFSNDDGPSDEAIAEVQTSIIGRAIGAPIVEVAHGETHAQVIMLLIAVGGEPGTPLDDLDEDTIQGAIEDGGRQIALLDFLTQNADRHWGNMLLDGNMQLWAIDHSRTLLDLDERWPRLDDPDALAKVAVSGDSLTPEGYWFPRDDDGKIHHAWSAEELDQAEANLRAAEGLDPKVLDSVLYRLDLLRLALPGKEVDEPSDPLLDLLRDEPDYRGQHQPNPDGATLDDLGADIPEDVYDHPEWYTSWHLMDRVVYDEAVAAMRRARGNPDAAITIYRSAPPDAGGIHPGDWVTLARGYAEHHGRHPDDPAQDMPVYEMTVRARDIRFAGDDIMEYGYFPDETNPTVVPMDFGSDDYETGEGEGFRLSLPGGARADIEVRDGEVHVRWIEVPEGRRGQGDATALLDAIEERYPGLPITTNDLTEAGQVLAQRFAKALPRDGDGDGWIDEGKPTERLARPRSDYFLGHQLLPTSYRPGERIPRKDPIDRRQPRSREDILSAAARVSTLQRPSAGPPLSDFVTVAQIAESLGVPKQTVYGWFQPSAANYDPNFFPNPVAIFPGRGGTGYLFWAPDVVAWAEDLDPVDQGLSGRGIRRRRPDVMKARVAELETVPKEEVMPLLDGMVTVREIAELADTSPESISWTLRNVATSPTPLDLPGLLYWGPEVVGWLDRRNAPGRDAATVASIAERYLAGETAASIAADIGVSRKTVIRDLRRNGIEVRPPGRRGATKALPRDGDGDGLIYEGTPRERPAPAVIQSFMSEVYRTRDGEQAIRGGAEAHMTLIESPIGAILHKDFLDKGSSGQREVAVSKMAQDMGVPAPVVVRDPLSRTDAVFIELFTRPDGITPAQTLQDYVASENPGRLTAETFSGIQETRRRIVRTEEGRKIALLDFVIGNEDRHGGNVLIVDGKPVAIDHSISLPSSFQEEKKHPKSLFVKEWVTYGKGEPMILADGSSFTPESNEIVAHPWSAEELNTAEAAVRAHLPAADKVGSPAYGALRRIELLRAVLGLTTKALPRDGDGDGLIYEGTSRERPAVVYSGNARLDRVIDDFLDEPMGDWTSDDSPIRSLADPTLAHGLCDEVTEQFVKYLTDRGWTAYVTRTDLDEMGYVPQAPPAGYVLDERGEEVLGFYQEHTVATVYVPDEPWPFYVDFTASQYGYSEHPKVTT